MPQPYQTAGYSLNVLILLLSILINNSSAVIAKDKKVKLKFLSSLLVGMACAVVPITASGQASDNPARLGRVGVVKVLAAALGRRRQLNAKPRPLFSAAAVVTKGAILIRACPPKLMRPPPAAQLAVRAARQRKSPNRLAEAVCQVILILASRPFGAVALAAVPKPPHSRAGRVAGTLGAR